MVERTMPSDNGSAAGEDEGRERNSCTDFRHGSVEEPREAVASYARFGSSEESREAVASRARCGSIAALRSAVAAHLDGAIRANAAFLLLPPSFDRQSWLRWFADEHPGLAFGLEVTTLPQHVQALWRLFGDDRWIVTDSWRELLAARALQDRQQEAGAAALPLTPGMARTLASAVREGFCHPEFPLRAEERATQEDAEIFRAIVRYRELLDEQRLVEYGSALLALAERKLPPADIVCVDADHLLPAEERYLSGAGAIFLTLDPSAAVDPAAARTGIPALVAHLYRAGAPLEPSAAIRFATASGPYAEPILIADIIADYVARGFDPKRIFIACADPEGLFSRVAPRLSRRGISAAGSIGCPFSGTLLGRTFLELRRTVNGLSGAEDLARTDAIAFLNDFARSPFCLHRTNDVFDLDTKMRGDRTLDVSQMLARLREDSATTDSVCRALAEARDVDALALLHQAGVASGKLDLVQQALSNAASTNGGKFLSDADSAGLAPELAFQLLAEIPVMTTCTMAGAGHEDTGAPTASAAEADDNAPADRSAVRFGTLEDLVSADASVALICQMTATGYPLAAKGDPLNSLFGQVGFERADTTLEDMRMLFKRAVAAVTDEIVFERTLNGDDAAPERASVLFEEVVDCFRVDITLADDLDEATGLPADLLARTIDGVPICLDIGEENLVALVPAPYGSTDDERDARPPIDVGGPDAYRLPSSAVARLTSQGGGDPVFSASQVEKYLSCPYKWFVESRIAPNALDQENDPAAYGSFAHAVLERFYRRFGETSPRRVDDSNLEEALRILDEEFDDERDHPSESLQNPLVLTGELDRRTLEEWRRKLQTVVADDARFLPGYTPRSFEHSFSADDGFRYAGYRFNGRIDRIDEDGDGHAVIIDYKGGLGNAFSPFGRKDGPDVPHAQALIYAQIARRDLGLDVVGSLYRSYNKSEVQGAYAAGAAEIGYDFTTNAYETGNADAFRELLDKTENEVAEAIERLLAGQIAPMPATSDACTWCAVNGTCPRCVPVPPEEGDQ